MPFISYVAMPNQLGIDHFDLEDALGGQKEYMCSADLKEFIETYHLDLSMDGNFNPRDAFGSHDDSDHVYNTPRAWFMERYLNPHTKKWDGPYADYTTVSDDIPWMMVPEKKITVEDVKYVLSSHYQGTPYDPYAAYGDKSWKGAYRSIGVNRTDFLSVIQMRPDHKGDNGILQWIAFASNAFNVLVPFYTDVTTTPEYLSPKKALRIRSGIRVFHLVAEFKEYLVQCCTRLFFQHFSDFVVCFFSQLCLFCFVCLPRKQRIVLMDQCMAFCHHLFLIPLNVEDRRLIGRICHCCYHAACPVEVIFPTQRERFPTRRSSDLC